MGLSLVVLSAFAPAHLAAAKKVPPCPDASYSVSGGGTLTITTVNKPATITYSLCSPGTGHVMGTKKGTKVQATIPGGCPAIGHPNTVQLKALIAPGCGSARVLSLKEVRTRKAHRGGGPVAVSFAATIGPLLNQTCASSAGCHSGATPAGPGLDLSTGNAYAALVNRPSLEVAGLLLVKPGDPTNSYCLQKLEGAAGISGAPMPLTGTPLSPDQIKAIHDWITEGAPNN
jgi:hypothetical protein